jgi:hypothetical protein
MSNLTKSLIFWAIFLVIGVVIWVWSAWSEGLPAF